MNTGKTMDSPSNDLQLWIEVKPPAKAQPSAGTQTPAPDQPSARTQTIFNIVIGLRIQCVACSNAPITNVKWEIENIAHCIADFVPSTATGTVIPLSPAALLNNPITFCWWQGGTFSVACTITTAIGSGKVSHSFVVTAPQVQYFKRTYTGVVGVGKYMGKDFIRFARSMGEFNVDGILMEAKVTGTQTIAGTLAGIQLASNQRFCTMLDSDNYKYNTNGQDILDIGQTNTVLYQNHQVTINAGQTVIYDATDGPGAELNASILKSMFIGDGDPPPVVPESYNMYLMFRATIFGAAWVPVKVMRWGWEGLSNLVNGHWLPAEDTGVMDPVTSDPTDFPQWTMNTGQSHWIPG